MNARVSRPLSCLLAVLVLWPMAAPAVPAKRAETVRGAPPPAEPVAPAASNVDLAEPAYLPLLPPDLPTERAVRVTGSAVRLREGPGVRFDAVGYAERGSVLSVMDEADGWFHCLGAADQPVWLAGEFTESIAETWMVVTGRGVNVRELPDIQARVLARMPRGAVVAALPRDASPERSGEDREWLRVRTSRGTLGWMVGRWLAPAPALDVLRTKLRFCNDIRVDASAVGTPAEQGTAWQIRTPPGPLVREGRLGLVALHKGSDSAREGLFQGQRMIAWYTFAGSSAMVLQLGFDPGAKDAGTAEALSGFHLTGDWDEQGAWMFHLTVPDTWAPAMLGLVVQEGPHRGCIVGLETISE